MIFNFTKGKEHLFPQGYTQAQVNIINGILAECHAQGVIMKEQVAYILATPYHECYDWNKPNSRMTQLTEMGGEAYLKSKPYYPYYGRGLSHLTWLANYKKEGARLGLDLVAHPNLILNSPAMFNSHVFCMMHGLYTGKKIPDYIRPGLVDYVGARRIINGTDKAGVIAGYAIWFNECLD